MGPPFHPGHWSIRSRSKNLTAVLRVLGPGRTLRRQVNCYMPSKSLDFSQGDGQYPGHDWRVIKCHLQHCSSPPQLPSLPDLQNLAQEVNSSIVITNVFICSFLCVKYHALCFTFIIVFYPLIYSMMLLFLSFTYKETEVRERLGTCPVPHS